MPASGPFRDSAGLTLPELLIAIAIVATMLAMSFGSYAQYREAVAASQAVRTIRADVVRARSLAIRTRSPVSLVADEAALRYEIRDTLGTLFHWREFGGGAEIQLTAMDVATAGDSLTFDARGILLTGNPRVDATRRGRTRSVTFNALGRGQIN